MQRARHFLLAGSLAILGLVAIGRSLGADPVSAKGLPSTPEVVRLEIEFLGGARAKVATLMGESATVKRGDGSLIEIKPERAGDGEIRLKIFTRKPGTAKSSPEEVLQLRSGEAAISKSSGLEIRWAAPGSASTGSSKPSGVSQPVSNLAFRGELMLPSGQTVRFATREGETLRVTLADGRRFGLVPTLKDSATGEASFDIVALEGNARDKAGERSLPLETLDLRIGAGQSVLSLDGSYVRLTQVQDLGPAPFQTSRSRMKVSGKLSSEVPPEELDGGTCCCGVGPERVCGCSVDSGSCFCCVGPCCGALVF